MAEGFVKTARDLRLQLHAVEQALCDMNVENFVYITGVHKR